VTAQQHFWNVMMAWGLGLSFVLVIAVIAVITVLVTSPAFEANWKTRQAHKRAVKMMKLKAELARKGTDPEYVKFLENEAFKER
jgi:uncharacterized membrane protein (DUF106 family)